MSIIARCEKDQAGRYQTWAQLPDGDCTILWFDAAPTEEQVQEIVDRIVAAQQAAQEQALTGTG